VERFDQIVNRALVARRQRIVDGVDIFGLEPVFLVMPLIIDAVIGAHLALASIGDQQVVFDDVIVDHVRRFRRGTSKSKRGG